MKAFWYNFKSKEYDLRDTLLTEEEALQYVPQFAAAQGLLQAHKASGKSVLNALKATLMSCVGNG